MKIAVIGAGAMGSLLAGLLGLSAQPGDETWLLGQPAGLEDLAALSSNGLAIELAPAVAANWPAAKEIVSPVEKTITVKNIRTAFAPALITEPVDLALVVVKSYRTAGAASQAAQILAPGGLAVTLQNGLGNDKALAEALGTGRVCQGVTSLGATLLGPGRVRFAGLGHTALGLSPELDEPRRALLRSLAGRWQALSLPVEVSENVPGLAWGKLVINCAINPLTALLRCPNGRLLEDPGTLELLEAAAREAAAVAMAAGIELPYPAEEAPAQARRVAALTAHNTSSMLSDVLKGRPTEIEAISGAVLREGQRLGIPTPLNRTLYLLVKALASPA